MAVATARRLRADRVAKDIVSRSLAQDESHPEVKMSFPVPPQPPGAGNQIPVTSPNSSEPFPLPQGGPDRDALRKRKASRAKAPADLRRTASTPQLGKISPHDLSILSPTDKRRNKLGYHRTSIACSKRTITRFYTATYLTEFCVRSLSEAQDSMPNPCSRRPSRTMHELHQIKKGLHLLRCRPGDCFGE